MEHPFTKFVNIVDPLLRSNNLGRSVSLCSYYRVNGVMRASAVRLNEMVKVVGLGLCGKGCVWVAVLRASW